MKNERNAGRKKKSDLEKRTKKISVYLNDYEYSKYLIFKEEIKKVDSSKSMQDYLRECFLRHFREDSFS